MRAPSFRHSLANCAPPQMTFNDVTYGKRPGTEAGYRSIAELDDRLRSRTPSGDAGPAAVGPNTDWVEVR